MLDQDERLAFRVYTRPVEGVAGHNADIGGEVLFESCDLWGFTRSLTADNGADFGGCLQLSVKAHLAMKMAYMAQTPSQRRQCSSLPRCR